MSERELRGITPTYQNLLINQLNGIVNAINEGNHLYAFRCLRTLIMSLNPSHKETLMKNHVKHIQDGIDGINKISDVDHETSRIRRRDESKNLAPQVLALYEEVMKTLHNARYLEIRGPIVPEGIEKGL